MPERGMLDWNRGPSLMNTNKAGVTRHSFQKAIQGDVVAARRALFSAASRVLSFHAAALDAKVRHGNREQRGAAPQHERAGQ